MTDKIPIVDSDTVLFSNSFVKRYSNRLVIYLYYFSSGNKTVHYDKIQSCELLEMRNPSFSKSKLWDIPLVLIWWHCDFSRYYILLNANQWMMMT